MADWRKLAASLVLADGRIEKREAEIIQKELLEDDVIDREEFEFIFDLRKRASSVVPTFNTFFFKVVAKKILADGTISAKETAWLRQCVFPKGKIDDHELVFLEDLHSRAREVDPEFRRLLRECRAAAAGI